MERLRWLVLVVMVAGSACDSATIAPPGEPPAKVSARLTAAPSSPPPAAPVAAPEAPRLLPWNPDHPGTTCTAVAAGTFVCPAERPRAFKCSSRADLPEGCEAQVKAGGHPGPAVRVCCS